MTAANPAVKTNLDLLSGLDFTAPPAIESIQPILQPISSVPSAVAVIVAKAPEPVALQPTIATAVAKKPNAAATKSIAKIEPPKPPQPIATSLTELSLDPALAGLDWNLHAQAMDAAAKTERTDDDGMAATSSSVLAPETLAAFVGRLDHFQNADTLKWFHRDVERYEKSVEVLNVKTLNGTTALDSKWKELQDLLVG